VPDDVASPQATPTGPSTTGRSSESTRKPDASRLPCEELRAALRVTAKYRAYSRKQQLARRCAPAQVPVMTEAGEHVEVHSLGGEDNVKVKGRTSRTGWRALAAAFASDDPHIPMEVCDAYATFKTDAERKAVCEGLNMMYRHACAPRRRRNGLKRRLTLSFSRQPSF